MSDHDNAIQAEALERAALECARMGDLCTLPNAHAPDDCAAECAEAYDTAAAMIRRLKPRSDLVAVQSAPSEGDVEAVARAMLAVKAAFPATDGAECLVLADDPEFDHLPRDHTEGTEDDLLTQTAMLRLARVAIDAFIAQQS